MNLPTYNIRGSFSNPSAKEHKSEILDGEIEHGRIWNNFEWEIFLCPFHTFPHDVCYLIGLVHTKLPLMTMMTMQ